MKPLLVLSILSVLSVHFFFTAQTTPSSVIAADAPLRTKIRIATAGLSTDLPAATIFDFSLSAAAAKELGVKK